VRKIRIGMLELDPVVPRARGDQDVSGRNRDSGGTGASGEIARGTPDRIVNAEFRQQPFEIFEYFFISVPAGAIP
jgi:hypothetical protein